MLAQVTLWRSRLFILHASTSDGRTEVDLGPTFGVWRKLWRLEKEETKVARVHPVDDHEAQPTVPSLSVRRP